MANIAVLYGSVRQGRVGINGANFLVNQLKKRKHTVTLIDSMKYKLPLLNKMHKEYAKGKAPKAMEAIHKILKKADGIMVVTAEYNHSLPPALKNMLDHFQSEYFFKPAAIASYSVGGFGGVRAALSLRVILPELGMPTIPSMFPMSKVHESFDKKGKDLTGSYEKRAKGFLDEFEWYVKAMKQNKVKKLG